MRRVTHIEKIIGVDWVGQNDEGVIIDPHELSSCSLCTHVVSASLGVCLFLFLNKISKLSYCQIYINKMFALYGVQNQTIIQINKLNKKYIIKKKKHLPSHSNIIYTKY